MAFLKTTYGCFVRRPFLIIYIAVISMFFSAVQFFNPITGMIQNLDVMESGSWTEALVYISKELYTIRGMTYIIPIILFASVLIALLSGLAGAGFMNVYHGTLHYGKKTWDLFLEGITKYYIRISLVFLQFYLAIFAFIILIPITTVPAIILAQKTAENGSTNFFTTGLLTTLTIIVLFLILSLIVMAFMFRFPSCFYFKKRPVEKSKSVVSSVFWRYFIAVCILTALFLTGEYLMLGIESKAGEFFAGWISHTVLMAAASAISFSGYSLMLEKFRK